MGQEGVGDVDLSVGYALKQAASALRGRMDAVLRPMELTVPQYACLELLGQRQGLSSAELARGAFVSRQAMNQVLRGLQERGLLERPSVTTRGRALPSRLTADGERALRAASRAVAEVERQMLGGFGAAREQRLRADLAACVAALAQPDR
ncbi:MarR family winged helix-turn-helix transcriptional regulator [Nocardia vermiculata]|uniref:MarR family transcriptional regulator n=1 Tax=Nocardia vermiculata TaxID=257274 RepID=A0A846Y5T5_9NOCA|nr:MarR family transcriptional regulator [Nocardia vermiculata]NKY52049.1 MarR family transcriptional regulator [Nocardia vermiculata]